MWKEISLAGNAGNWTDALEARLDFLTKIPEFRLEQRKRKGQLAKLRTASAPRKAESSETMSSGKLPAKKHQPAQKTEIEIGLDYRLWLKDISRLWAELPLQLALGNELKFESSRT